MAKQTKKDQPTHSDEVLSIVNGSLNTSQKIRALHSTGMSKGDIARILNKRYQHVRNVLITPIKKQ